MRLRARLAVRVATACLVVASLAGCKKEIYHGLSETEANEIIVELDARGIKADKVLEKGEGGGGKKGLTFSIVCDEDVAVQAARELLQAQLPRERQKGFADVYGGPASMIPTLTEEKARYLLSAQGELVSSLEQVDGVVDARVHLVLPEENPLESSKDRTPARASVLIKYRERQRPEKEEARVREEASYFRGVLISLNEDLRRFRQIVTTDLPALGSTDQQRINTIDTYLTQKRAEDPEAKEARAALAELKQNALERAGKLKALQALPKIKDMESPDSLLRKLDSIELASLPFTSASVRALVARATPRLSEDDVAVEFTKAIEKPPPQRVALAPREWWQKKELVVGIVALAIALALGLSGTAFWALTLKKSLAEATARLQAAAGAVAGAPTGGGPGGAAG